MPRDVYYQSVGNPVQTKLLPKEKPQIQFAYQPEEIQEEISFANQFLRNLYLLSAMGFAAHWLGDNFVRWFPINVWMVGVVLMHMSNLWQDRSTFYPRLAFLLAIWGVHFARLPVAVDIALLFGVLAILGREFTRHFVHVATTFPYTGKTANNIRAAWSIGSFVTAALLIPLALALYNPSWTLVCLGITLGGCLLSLLLVEGNPAQAIESYSEAWLSWCTYNRKGNPSVGLLVSPAGSCAWRLGLLVVCVLQTSLFFAEFTQELTGFGAARLWELLRGIDSSTSNALGRLVACGVALAFWITVPVVLVFVAVGIVSFSALSSLRIPPQQSTNPHGWNQITRTIQSSSNPIERNSIYMGKLAYDQSPLLVPREVFQEHAHILGDSGSGKTARGLIPLAEQLIADGQSSLMVIDLKGDSQEIFSSLQIAAERTKPGPDKIPLKYFSVREDHATYGFNTFQLPCWNRLNLFQKTDILCGALGLVYGTDYGKGYFSSANAAVLYATLKHFPAIGSFTELADRIAYVMHRPKLHGLDDSSAQAGNHVWMTAERLASFKALNITQNSTPTPQVHQRSMDPSSLFINQEVFYFNLSSTLGPGSSPEIARLAIFMLLTSATLVERCRPVYLMIDEFQRMAAHNVDVVLQIARSMNVGVILANQSMLDLKRYDLIHVLESNCRYRQWYAISSPDEQDRLSKASGQTIDTMHSTSISRRRDLHGNSTTETHTLNQVIVPRLSINDIKFASDDPNKSIAVVNRGAGYSQFGGMPVIVNSDFHISREEFLKRKNQPWPSPEIGSFVAATWQPSVPQKARTTKKSPTPHMTEETIGAPANTKKPSMFDKFLADYAAEQERAKS